MTSDMLADMVAQLDEYGILQHLTADEVEAVRITHPDATAVVNQFDPSRFDLITARKENQ